MPQFPTIETLVKDALNKFDPASCMEPSYEAEVQVITHLLGTFRIAEPEAAAQLSVDELAKLLTEAHESKEDLEVILKRYAQEILAAA